MSDLRRPDERVWIYGELLKKFSVAKGQNKGIWNCGETLKNKNPKVNF